MRIADWVLLIFSKGVFIFVTDCFLKAIIEISTEPTCLTNKTLFYDSDQNCFHDPLPDFAYLMKRELPALY